MENIIEITAILICNDPNCDKLFATTGAVRGGLTLPCGHPISHAHLGRHAIDTLEAIVEGKQAKEAHEELTEIRNNLISSGYLNIESTLEQVLERFENRKQEAPCMFFRRRKEGEPIEIVRDLEECPKCQTFINKGTMCACELDHRTIQGCLNLLGNGDRGKGQKILVALVIAVENERHGGE